MSHFPIYVAGCNHNSCHKDTDCTLNDRILMKEVCRSLSAGIDALRLDYHMFPSYGNEDVMLHVI